MQFLIDSSLGLIKRVVSSAYCDTLCSQLKNVMPSIFLFDRIASDNIFFTDLLASENG